MRLKRAGVNGFRFRETPMLTEGYFVGLAWEESGRFSTCSHFFRVQVESVSSQGELEARVDKSVVEHFENVKIVGLFRPLDSTTAAMQAAPVYAPVSDGSQEIIGMAHEQQQQLVGCKLRLKQIGIAMHNFHGVHSHFPTANRSTVGACCCCRS